jgi:hypothetical protein
MNAIVLGCEREREVLLDASNRGVTGRLSQNGIVIFA